MQDNWLELRERFQLGEAYVLAVIINTEGATYQKTGAMMLIDKSGRCYGLLSGGCLEADIALHAGKLEADAAPLCLSYDLRGDEALLWGLGAGCEGKVEILLQPINPHNKYLDFDSVLSAIASAEAGSYLLSLEKNSASFAKKPHQPKPLPGATISIDIIAPPKLVIVGAGPDVIPLLMMAKQLNWSVCVCDHRRQHLESLPSFVETKQCQQADARVFEQASALVIMSHNLERDQQWLAAALASKLGYIGLLGPEKRKLKLLKAIAGCSGDDAQRVYGPIGLDLGGRGPAAIALSICAQLQVYFSKSDQIKAY